MLVIITGTGVKSHLATLQQRMGKAGKAVSPEKLHFSFFKTEGSCSAEELKCLAEKVKDMLQPQQAEKVAKMRSLTMNVTRYKVCCIHVYRILSLLHSN